MKDYIPQNSINAKYGEELANAKLDVARSDVSRLRKYNAELKLQVIELRQKIIKIQKILNKKIDFYLNQEGEFVIRFVI